MGGSELSVKKRWLLAAITAILGGAWVVCAVAGHHGTAINDALRTLFLVAAVALVLCHLVTPMSASLHVGRQIGRAEQRRECGCQVDRSAAPRPSNRILPFKPPSRN
jgi:hypothetical protein